MLSFFFRDLLHRLAGALGGLCLVLAAPTPQAMDDPLAALQQDIDRFADLATETKHNVDYMPYVVSTLHGDDLASMGVNTLLDALRLVPGVGVSIGMAGLQNPIFRGSNPFAYGQSKLVIDGMVMSVQLFGGYNQFLDMPIELIHRIEVVRGPGSLLPHLNGYSGSIHVITKGNRDDGESPERELFAAVGSDDYRKVGGVASAQIGDFALSADVVGQRHDQVSPEIVDRYGTRAQAEQGLRHYDLGLNVSNGGFSAKGRFARNRRGVGYGQAFSLSEDDNDYLDLRNNSVDLVYEGDLSQGVSMELALGYFDETRTLQNRVVPDGGMIPMPPMQLPFGRYFLVDYQERTFRQRAELDIRRFADHRLTLGVLFEQSSIEENQGAFSDDGLASFRHFELLDTDRREHVALYFEDLWDIDERLSLQLGGKYDHYSDVEDQFSSRLALVYRHDDDNIFKAMFTQSFREPAWREQYLNTASFYRANPDLDVERVQAWELAYIHQFAIGHSLKINGFLLRNSDQIHAQNLRRMFVNNPNSRLWGGELEYQAPVGSRGRFSGYYSFVTGENVTDALANSTRHMLKGSYSHRLTQAVSLSAIFSYVGEKDRIAEDRRDSVADFFTLDVAASYRHKPTGTQFTFSVRNLFDESYYQPSPFATYSEDFEQQGRSFLLGLRQSF